VVQALPPLLEMLLLLPSLPQRSTHQLMVLL
jgi:hypothetical protein